MRRNEGGGEDHLTRGARNRVRDVRLGHELVAVGLDRELENDLEGLGGEHLGRREQVRHPVPRPSDIAAGSTGSATPGRTLPRHGQPCITTRDGDDDVGTVPAAQVGNVGLRRKRKVEAELLELVRGEFEALRTELQSSVAESAAVLSGRVRTEIEARMGEPRSLVAGIQSIRETIAGHDSDLVHALRQVGATCDALAERVQIDRVERTALADAISRLTTTLAVAGSFALPTAAPARETVIGGTVEPTVPPTDPVFTRSEMLETLSADEIDLEAVALAGEPAGPAPTGLPVSHDGVEVRCRFGDRWVTGFEVCEVIRLDDSTRYRLRRRSDGSVIPTLFGEKDVRFFSTSFAEPT